MSENKGYFSFSKFVENKRVSLIGIGVSNLPLVAFLYGAGAAEVCVRDLKKKSEDPEIIKAQSDGASIVLGKDYLENLAEDIIIRSPGIRPDISQFLTAEEQGSLVTCETELFLRFAPCTTVAVTGSDGKTTTTTLISKILKEAGHTVFLGGNIGRAMLPQLKDIESPDCFAVMELSSFQLMRCRFSPDIAVITNLSENHLDWHRDMAEYLDAKKNILLHQKESGKAVLNFDNKHTKSCNTNGIKMFFSCEAESNFGAESSQDTVFYQNDEILIRRNGQVQPYLKVKDIILPGKHNVENYMAAIGATCDYVSSDDVRAVATSFGGVEHRIEFVRELDGVKFYNSSIDSSPSRSTAALRAFSEKVIMIAGGYDKNLDYTSLGDEICERVKILILCGATKEKILSATKKSKLYQENAPLIVLCDCFEETVKIAKERAKPGDKVILSPASASFDLFKNFEERGKYYKNLVMEL